MKEPVHGCHEGIRFTDADVVNPDEYDPDPRRRAGACVPWLLHDHGFPLCVVFASCEQDALDEAVDHDKLDRYLVTDLADYPKKKGSRSWATPRNPSTSGLWQSFGCRIRRFRSWLCLTLLWGAKHEDHPKVFNWRLSVVWGACARCTKAASLSELHTLGALKSGRGQGGRKACAAAQMEIG